jgi:nitrate/nitrite transporter NarK
LLADPKLFDSEQVSKLQLPDEALSIVEQSSPTPQETERLNRLVLEVLFPGSFKEVYGRSWRSIVMIYGLLGVVIGIPFWLLFRNRPEEHPRCNEAEVALIRGPYAVKPSHSRKLDAIPWSRIILSLSVWCCCLVQIFTNIGWTFIVTWMPRYLQEVHQVPLTERAVMTSLPMICGIVGNFLGGWLTDAVTHRFGLRLGRSLPVAFTRFLAAAAFAMCLFSNSAWGFTILMCVMAFSVDLGIASTWAFNQDIGGRYVATVLGWGNMWGNLAAGVSPMLLNYTIEKVSWYATFVTCAGCFVAAGAIAFGINATISIDEQTKEE